MKAKRNLPIIAVFAAVILISVNQVTAATIAWWSFEEADTRPSTVTLASRTNSPTLDATLGETGSVLSDNVAAPGISAGIDGPVYANTQSLYQNNGATNTVNPAATSVLNDLFVNNSASWTWETFAYFPTDIEGAYGQLFGNGTPTAQGIQFDTGFDGQHFRFLSNGAVLLHVDSITPFSLDTWYHIALTANYVGGAWDLAFYIDYTLVNTATGVTLTTASGDYGIASPLNSFGGYVDEMRISTGVLSTNEMLHTSAVPEPQVAALIMASGLFWLIRRKKPALS